MLLHRIVTAAVLVPLMLAGIYLLPDSLFRVFIGLIVLLAAWEWANVSGIVNQSGRVAVAVMMSIWLFVLHVLFKTSASTWLFAIVLSLLWWAFALWGVLNYPNKSGWLTSRFLRLSVMFPVLGSFWMGLVWLKLAPESTLLLTWLMLLVWGADVGAYFSGRAFGGAKLAPNVSPGKTWAGVYGGMLTSVLISIGIAFWFLPKQSLIAWVCIVVMSSMVVAISVLGDLFESLMKRNRGIKDSSSLLPGHGGVLDRVDSLCAATPMFVVFWFVLSTL